MFSYTGSGGITTGGSADCVLYLDVTLGGSSVCLLSFSRTASGGVTTGGVSVPRIDLELPVEGGIDTGGRGLCTLYLDITLGGEFVCKILLSRSMSGGVETDGESVTLLKLSRSGSGGCSVAGSAVCSTPSLNFIASGCVDTSLYTSHVFGFYTGSNAVGTLHALLQEDGRLIYRFAYSDLGGGHTITSAYFRLGDTGSGPVVHTLNTTGSTWPDGIIRGSWSAASLAPYLEALKSGRLYFVLGTTVFPSGVGEITGRVVGRMLYGGASLIEPFEASGGIDIAGVAGNFTAYKVLGLGGATTAGVSPLSASYASNCLGGIDVAGKSGLVSRYNFVGSGGATTSGDVRTVLVVNYTEETTRITRDPSGSFVFEKFPLVSGEPVVEGSADISIALSRSSSGGATVAGVSSIVSRYEYLVSGGVSVSGISLEKSTYKADVSGGVVSGGASVCLPYLKYVSRDDGGVETGGSGVLGRATWKYVPRSSTSRFFVFGSASIGANTYFPVVGGGPSTSGYALTAAVCDRSCVGSSPKRRCLYTDPGSGLKFSACAGMKVVKGISTAKRPDTYALVASITVCNENLFTKDNYGCLTNNLN